MAIEYDCNFFAIAYPLYKSELIEFRIFKKR